MSRWQKERVGVKKKKRKAAGMKTNPAGGKRRKFTQENHKKM